MGDKLFGSLIKAMKLAVNIPNGSDGFYKKDIHYELHEHTF
jgi:hypothetical protein